MSRPFLLGILLIRLLDSLFDFHAQETRQYGLYRCRGKKGRDASSESGGHRVSGDGGIHTHPAKEVENDAENKSQSQLQPSLASRA